jgi:hypothetical protein
VASFSLKMWTGPESVMRVLEYVGLIQKVGPENEHDHYVMRTVFCLFVSLQMCRLMNFWLEAFCSIIYHEMVYLFSKSTVMLAQIVVGIGGSPPALPMSDEPQADLDPDEVETDTPPPLPPPLPPPVLPMSDEPQADLDAVEVPTETPPPFVSDEHRAEMEGLVKKAEEIAAASNQDIPQAYLCPIGLTVMVIPVITGTGYTYDMERLSVWFQHNNRCPCTRAQTRMLTRNLVLEGLIEKWAQDVISNHTNVHESMSIVEPQHSSDLRQGVTRIRAAVARAENLEQALARLRGAVTGSESDSGDSDSDTDEFENWDFQDL